MPNSRIIYMIGHSNHDLSAFIALLQRHSIRSVIDVRTKPASFRVPQFNRARIEGALQQVGIEYQWEPTLGGLEPRPRSEILQALETILRSQDGACFMCSEGDFRKCHRHHLLAPLVRQLGSHVRQVLPTGEVVEDVEPM